MFETPQILGIPLIVIGGILLFLSLLIQLATGLRWIKINPKYHKWLGFIIFILASLHAMLGISLFYS